jgi:hypothetical protein
VTDVHAALGIVVLAGAVVFTVAAAAAARFSSVGPSAAAPGGKIAWLERFRVGLTAAIVVQMALGAVLYAQDYRPGETIHLLYGLAAVVALPLGSVFASEAPGRARLWVLAIAGAATAGTLWRLWGTG